MSNFLWLGNSNSKPQIYYDY